MCTVFEEAAYAGNCILPGLKPGEKRLLPHALETGVSVQRDQRRQRNKVIGLRLSQGCCYTQALQRLETDKDLRVRLAANADRLYDGLRDMGYAVGPHASPITAVVMPDQATAVTMWNALLANGVYLNLAIPPATPENKSLLRSSVSAAHTPQQIDEVLDIFERLGLEYGLLQRARRASA